MRFRKPSFQSQELPGWLNGLLIAGTFVTLIWLERKRPLRRERQPKLSHDARNLTHSVLSALTIRATEKPLTDRLSRLVEQRRWGVVKALRLPPALDLALAVVLLDYTLYIWHVLTHKVPLLWRFHQAHHVDLDLDASTALRFHFGEMLLSVPWRAAQVVVIGASPLALSVWQTATLLEILFHHSNVRLPHRVERWLCRLIVTPRMHGIHHSIVQQETDSNWSTIFTFPDYLHGTLRLNVPQQAITIGVPAFQEPAELTFGNTLALPVTADRPSWQFVNDGSPQREGLAMPPTVLAE